MQQKDKDWWISVQSEGMATSSTQMVIIARNSLSMKLDHLSIMEKEFLELILATFFWAFFHDGVLH